MSARNCIVQSDATIPPSTRSTVSADPCQSPPCQSACIASIRSRVWYATLSSAARANSAGPELRTSPNIAPRASASHHGAPSPVNAGTRYTCWAGSAAAANPPASAAAPITPSPSRNHCTAAPATKIAPSSA